MIKKLFVAIICFSMFLLCGCASSPAYTIYQDEDGQVEEIIFVPFSASELRASGLDDETKIVDFKNSIYQKVQTYYLDLTEKYLFRINYDISFTEEDKNFLKNAVNYNLSGGKAIETNQGIYFSVEYKNVLSYYYYKIQKSYLEIMDYLKQDDSVINNTPYYYQKINTSTTVFGQLQADNTTTFAVLLQDTTRNWLSDNTMLSNEKIEELVPKNFIYRYGVASKRLHSNSDRVFFQDGVYFHEWNISAENATREISTWTTHANKNMWYSTILICGVGLVIVLFLINFIKPKKIKNTINVNDVIDIS